MTGRYVETLEARLEKMEALLQQVRCSPSAVPYPAHRRVQFRPDINITAELENPNSSLHEKPHSNSSAAASPLQIPSPSSGDDASGSAVKQEVDSDDEEYGYSTLLSNRMTGLAIAEAHHHFLGKSSNVKLVRSTLHLHNEDASAQMLDSRRPEFWAPLPVSI